MSLTKKDYKNRLIDDKISEYLKIFGAVSIVGPKWCGKTWTSLNHANSVSFMTEKSQRDLAKVDPKYIFAEERPQLIDEWQLVPTIWDAVRHECDKDHNKGKFILTGSTTLTKEEEKENVYHSGAGRIALMNMYPMSLYESGDSTGDISITDMINGTANLKRIGKIELEKIAQLVIRGGWPENINVEVEKQGIIPKSYIESIIYKDIKERKDKKRDSQKMLMLLKSLSRNESSVASNDTLVKEIEEFTDDDGNYIHFDLVIERFTCNCYLSAKELQAINLKVKEMRMDMILMLVILNYINDCKKIGKEKLAVSLSGRLFSYFLCVPLPIFAGLILIEVLK